MVIYSRAKFLPLCSLQMQLHPCALVDLSYSQLQNKPEQVLLWILLRQVRRKYRVRFRRALKLRHIDRGQRFGRRVRNKCLRVRRHLLPVFGPRAFPLIRARLGHHLRSSIPLLLSFAALNLTVIDGDITLECSGGRVLALKWIESLSRCESFASRLKLSHAHS